MSIELDPIRPPQPKLFDQPKADAAKPNAKVMRKINAEKTLKTALKIIFYIIYAAIMAALIGGLTYMTVNMVGGGGVPLFAYNFGAAITASIVTGIAFIPAFWWVYSLDPLSPPRYYN